MPSVAKIITFGFGGVLDRPFSGDRQFIKSRTFPAWPNRGPISMLLRCVAALTFLLLTGCGFVSYEDVSGEPEYSKYVGTRYRTTEDMEIYRISMERNYGPLPSIYEIVQSPGFGGPEVLARTDFPEGSTMQILSVKRCKDCYLDEEPRMHVVVRLDSDRRFDDWEVQVDLGLLSSHMQEVTEFGSRD
ncbi:hypothetical protein [Pseudoxanthomonas sp. z9]|uniref:hypothetical protein n=1 Tax=Pseudoxanthomonas sp. z9 TaxID=2584942 RepID=UPI0011413DED|nr:hypothetical protein [Pseudoxanthomonas sp. z9]